MTQLQISVMLPAIDSSELGDMSPAAIIEALGQVKDVEKMKQEITNLKRQIGSYGRSLELILNEVDDPFEKAKSLRNLSNSMREYNNG